MMRATLLWSILAASLALAFAGCSEREPTGEIRAHPDAWMLESDADFHGEKVERDGAESCRGCHGADLAGFAAAPSCFECHDGAGGHPEGWASRPDPGHVEAVAMDGNEGCTDCHGADFRGGWSQVSCYSCHAGGPSGHPDGWLDDESSAFHGFEVMQNGSLRCTSCHGADLGGGSSGISCSQAGCHS